MSLGKADVERPPALSEVLGLRRGEQVHAVIALVVLGDTDLDADGFVHARDSIREIAHYLATHLNPPALADDAQVWAVAPPGLETVAAWKRLREEVHQDTWSVPKSVWLPGGTPDPTAFLDEGVLAEPWDAQSEGAAESLDLLDRFAKKLSGKRGPWDRERVRQFLDGLTDSEREPALLAESLLRLAEVE